MISGKKQDALLHSNKRINWLRFVNLFVEVRWVCDYPNIWAKEKNLIFYLNLFYLWIRKMWFFFKLSKWIALPNFQRLIPMKMWLIDAKGLGVYNSNKSFMPRWYLEVHDKED